MSEEEIVISILGTIALPVLLAIAERFLGHGDRARFREVGDAIRQRRGIEDD